MVIQCVSQRFWALERVHWTLTPPQGQEQRLKEIVSWEQQEKQQLLRPCVPFLLCALCIPLHVPCVCSSMWTLHVPHANLTCTLAVSYVYLICVLCVPFHVSCVCHACSTLCRQCLVFTLCCVLHYLVPGLMYVLNVPFTVTSSLPSLSLSSLTVSQKVPSVLVHGCRNKRGQSAQGHRTSKGQSWGSKPGWLFLELTLKHHDCLWKLNWRTTGLWECTLSKYKH